MYGLGRLGLQDLGAVENCNASALAWAEGAYIQLSLYGASSSLLTYVLEIGCVVYGVCVSFQC